MNLRYRTRPVSTIAELAERQPIAIAVYSEYQDLHTLTIPATFRNSALPRDIRQRLSFQIV